MCVEKITVYLGLTIYGEVMVPCGHHEVVIERCKKARGLFSRFSRSVSTRDSICKDLPQEVEEVDSLCPNCQGQADSNDDPFALSRMARRPKTAYVPGHSATFATTRPAPRPKPSRASTMPGRMSQVTSHV